jgi:hypothetical protein
MGHHRRDSGEAGGEVKEKAEEKRGEGGVLLHLDYSLQLDHTLPL